MLKMINTMKIGSRLGASFALVLLLTAAVAAFGISRMSSIQTNFDKVTKETREAPPSDSDFVHFEEKKTWARF
jgi:CHASE3 domain sensor protein